MSFEYDKGIPSKENFEELTKGLKLALGLGPRPFREKTQELFDREETQKFFNTIKTIDSEFADEISANLKSRTKEIFAKRKNDLENAQVAYVTFLVKNELGTQSSRKKIERLCKKKITMLQRAWEAVNRENGTSRHGGLHEIIYAAPLVSRLGGEENLVITVTAKGLKFVTNFMTTLGEGKKGKAYLDALLAEIDSDPRFQGKDHVFKINGRGSEKSKHNLVIRLIQKGRVVNLDESDLSLKTKLAAVDACLKNFEEKDLDKKEELRKNGRPIEQKDMLIKQGGNEAKIKYLRKLDLRKLGKKAQEMLKSDHYRYVHEKDLKKHLKITVTEGMRRMIFEEYGVFVDKNPRVVIKNRSQVSKNPTNSKNTQSPKGETNAPITSKTMVDGLQEPVQNGNLVHSL